RVVFNGNNYAEEWLHEAERRGLEAIGNCVDAYKTLLRDKNIAVYKNQGVLSPEEVESRFEIYIQDYAKTINIEATTMLMMAKTQLIPNFTEYLTKIASCAVKLDKLGIESSTKTAVRQYSEILDKFTLATQKLDEVLCRAKAITDDIEKSEAYRDEVVPAMNQTREWADKLETMTSKEGYKMPTYSDIMFYN
ncbi:MAG: hypothetical protein IKK40_08170, partial [Bacteroidales bacterium]|nr:hypothetical protein [Bacteroidales bacterium]